MFSLTAGVLSQNFLLQKLWVLPDLVTDHLCQKKKKYRQIWKSKLYVTIHFLWSMAIPYAYISVFRRGGENKANTPRTQKNIRCMHQFNGHSHSPPWIPMQPTSHRHGGSEHNDRIVSFTLSRQHRFAARVAQPVSHSPGSDRKLWIYHTL